MFNAILHDESKRDPEQIGLEQVLRARDLILIKIISLS